MNPDTQLYCIRHAESAANVDWHLVSGRSNESLLSERGPHQAKALGRFFVSQSIYPDFVYASPAVRTLETARHTLQEMGLNVQPVVEDDLQEMDQGQWVGRPRDEVYSEAVVAEIAKLGKDFKAPGGHSMNEVGEVMLRIATIIADRHVSAQRPVKIFAFTHGLAIRCLASHIHGWTQKQTYEADTPNASVSLFSRTSGKWKLEYLGLEAS